MNLYCRLESSATSANVLKSGKISPIEVIGHKKYFSYEPFPDLQDISSVGRNPAEYLGGWQNTGLFRATRSEASVTF